MTNPRKFSNNTSNNNTNNNKAQNDDDNCSVICYKDSDDGHVGVVRIRQQPVCTACSLMRGTLALYSKHILENNHRENVKKLCGENRFVPSVYDQAMHLAFQNNFCYQSEKFHFLYKHTNEEIDSSSNDLSALMELDTEKMETINQQKTTPTQIRKRRSFEVNLVFDGKTYSKIGTATAQIREQLLKEMLADRATDVAALPLETYFIKKKIAHDDIHHNAQKSSSILTMAKDQSQAMLKHQQQPDPSKNGDMSTAKNSREDNGVEQVTAMPTHEISTAEKIDIDEQPSIIDDVMNVCKDALNSIVMEIYSKSGELKREQQFLSGVARRSFKKKNTFFCDICSIFLTSEKYCIQHLNGPEHLGKIRHYQTSFPPWRQAMQESIAGGRSMKEIMGDRGYQDYKATMAVYLAPNSLSNRGRFCCAYCEVMFTDQWVLEKHLHTAEHRNKKQTSSDHKDLVVRFANVVILPSVFKFNGITQLSEIPDDIKTRYQWRPVTREQLDEDTTSFIRSYPFDTFEGATRTVHVKPDRRQKVFAPKSSIPNPRNTNLPARNQQGRRSGGGGFNRTRGGAFPTPTIQRGVAVKRSFPVTAPPNKRFRTDFHSSFPNNNRTPVPMRNFPVNQYNYGRPAPFNNGNDSWPSRYPANQQQQRQELFEQSNFELRSLASDNNGYYNNRPAQDVPRGNNYDRERQPSFDRNGREGHGNPQSNYDSNFIRAVVQAVAEYHPGPNSSAIGGPHQHSYHQQANTGPTSELIHHVANSLQRSQQQPLLPSPAPSTNQMPYQNNNSFSSFGGNNTNNPNSNFYPSSGNQQPNTMGNNAPSVRSYADYRGSSALPANNSHSSMYTTSLSNTQNLPTSQPRTFDEFNLSPLTCASSSSYGRPGASSFSSEDSRYNGFAQQNQIEQPPQTSWRGSSRGGNNTRGRGGHFQSTNKQPGSTFSYSSSSISSNNNNNYNNSSMRGRGAVQNGRGYRH